MLWNGSHAMNVADPVRYHAQRRPAGMALVDGAESLDWIGLQKRIDAAAYHLQQRGVEPGDTIVLAIRSSTSHVVLTLAAARLGATGCAIDWRSRQAERDAILAGLAPRLLLTDVSRANAGPTEVLVDRAWQQAPVGVLPPAAGEATAPAFLLLSSGTTGQPKAAALGHEAAAWRGIVRMHSLGFRPASRVLNTMPLHASAAVAGLLGQIIAGATAVFMPALFAADELADSIARQEIEHVAVVPTVLRELLRLPSGSSPLLPGLQSLVNAGAMLHPEEKAAVMARLSPNLHEYYGSAATGPIATCGPHEAAQHPGSVGRPVLFTQVDIVDEQDRPLPPGAVGRVRVRSPGLATHHVGDAAASHESVGKSWAYPGDLGRLDERGLLYLEGRAGTVIIRGGENLQPEEIEGVLLRHPAIAEAAVVGRRDERLGQVPVAVLVLHHTIGPAAIEAHCRQHLSAQKVPVAFRFVADLPKTHAGKLSRADLAALVGDD
jgi:long-chain acyl-CoA synthetase